MVTQFLLVATTGNSIPVLAHGLLAFFVLATLVSLLQPAIFWVHASIRTINFPFGFFLNLKRLPCRQQLPDSFTSRFSKASTGQYLLPVLSVIRLTRCRGIFKVLLNTLLVLLLGLAIMSNTTADHGLSIRVVANTVQKMILETTDSAKLTSLYLVHALLQHAQGYKTLASNSMIQAQNSSWTQHCSAPGCWASWQMLI